MKKDYYILKSGRLKRKQNTLYLETKEEKKPIPINEVNAIFVMGELDINTKLLVFLSQKRIPIHFFNYYGYYVGTYYPREYLNSGFLIVKQVESYLDKEKRLKIAKEIVNSAIHNILKNLQYYEKQGKDVSESIKEIESERKQLGEVKDIPNLMGIEGRVREYYYQSFNVVLRAGFEFEKRVKRPPDNMINCLISFGNSLLYTTTLTEIYHTQLNPTISYLHEPGERRFSLSLDISEIFKPIITDRIIFSLVNNRIIKESHFLDELNFCYLNEEGRRTFISMYDKKLKTTIMHKELKRKVSYQKLIRLECYKLIKHLIGEKEYEGFKSGW
ncbi:MAG: type I-B CRISPR-associated endonuclease Cas1b [Candidatus Parvarchaeota archaeon]|nr:type I-B CRISPR-associated endonuclease Cas1b [Candidatus Jingweiarchaeum tengchongense]MCW1310317.1 type I-B CRISPR-associated endonuclease Cas1b [Candidatus Jingweiarchaeum tengchongense]